MITSVKKQCFLGAAGSLARCRWLAAGSLIVLASACNEPRERPKQSAPAADKPADTAQILAESLWPLSSARHYALKLTSSTAIDSGAPMASFTLESELTLTARAAPAGGSGRELLLQLTSPKLTTAQEDAQPQYDALAKELAAPALLTLQGGRLEAERIAPTLSVFAESVLRSIIASLQLRVGDRTLTLSERDATGTYVAESKPLAEPGAYGKRKLRYEPLTLSTGSVPVQTRSVAPEVLESSSDIRLVGSSLAHLATNERISVTVSSGTKLINSTQLTLDFTVAAAEPNAPWDTVTAATVAVTPGAPRGTRGDPAMFDQLRIGGRTFPQVVKALEAQEKAGGASALNGAVNDKQLPIDEQRKKEQKLASAQETFGAAVALLRSEPSTLALAEPLIRKNGLAAPALMDALASAGTDAAQALLARVIGDEHLPRSLRLRAAGSLIRTEQATEETVRLLTSLRKQADFETHSYYGLGTIARKLRDSGQEAPANRIVDVLIEDLGQKPGESLTVSVLRGIANSGNSRAFDAVEPYLKSESAALRGAAVDAVRLMNGARVDSVLETMLDDTTDAVRLVAVEALRLRSPTPSLIAAARRVAQNDKSSSVRQRSVAVLAQWAPDHPEAAQTLRAVANADPNVRVREDAAKAQ